MKYNGNVFGKDAEISIEKEGIRLGERFLDYSEVSKLIPINHRVRIDTLSGEMIEVSMLGFSYDGFWDELIGCFAKRSLESLFVDEEQIMLCEGEYMLPDESGRGLIALYPDSVCVLPQTFNAVRIPLCFTERLWLDGYLFHILMQSGVEYVVGRMGYDTTPFAERAIKAAELVKEQRCRALKEIAAAEPFTEKGLFRTKHPEQYWNAVFGNGVCAVELFAGEDAATYLYRFSEDRDEFLAKLNLAMEATGTHREVIYMTDEQLAANPLYLMTVLRTPAVRFLRERSDGRLIHNKNHREKLERYIQQGKIS